MIAALLVAVLPHVRNLALVADERQVAAAISKSVGISVRFDPRVQPRTLTVAIHDRPLDDVLNHLAYATFTRITKASAGYILVPDRLAEEKELAAYHQRIIEDLKELDQARVARYLKRPFTVQDALAYKEALKAAKNHESQPPTNSPSIDPEILPRPISRALTNLLHGIPPEKLSRPGHRLLVYTDKPRSTEWQLPLKLTQDVLWKYRQEYALSEPSVDREIARVLLVIRGTDTMDSPSAELLLLDDEDNAIDSVSLPIYSPSRHWQVSPELLKRLSDSDTFQRSHLDEVGATSAKATESDIWKSSHPTQYDPQNFQQGEVLLAAAKQSGLNMLMCFPDGQIGYSEVQPVSTNPLKFSLKACVASMWRRPIRVDSTWISYRPADAGRLTPYQYNRIVLEQEIYRVSHNIDSGMIGRAKLCFASRMDFMPGQLWWYLRGSHAEKLALMDPNVNHGFFRFLGSLTDKQRTQWLGGAKIPVSLLSKESKTLLERWVEGEEMEPNSYLRHNSANKLYPEAAPKGLDGAILDSGANGQGIQVSFSSGFCCRPNTMFM